MLKFPENFIWGTATASYQIEGATTEDGRGESIWDRFSHTPGKTRDADTGDMACDHYHRFREDIAIMKEMGLKGYRFSIAWPRIFPEGKERLNHKGLDFYNALIDALLAAGIEPLVTLYHWDLPQVLQEKGGWDNRDTAGYFADYAVTMFNALGDRVPKWLTLNEPSVVSWNGNVIGEHAPGFTDYSLGVRVSHHLNLGHAQAVRAFRDLNLKSEIGIAENLATVYPASVSPADGAAAQIADGWANRWFLDPVLKGTYPADMLKLFQEKFQAPVIGDGDMALIAGAKLDFLGINYYSPTLAQAASAHPLGYQGVFGGRPITDMGWEIYPDGLFDLLKRLDRDYDQPRIYITENGAAFKDQLVGGRIADPGRIDYLKGHFAAAHRAIDAGVRLEGYYVWSMMDNFEWAHGFSKRFGLIYTDYPTQQRIWKDSALWFRDMIKNNGI